jgi:hypothetical protein
MRRRRCRDDPLAESTVATGNTVEVGTIDDPLAPARDELVDGDLAHAMTNAHLAGRDRHRDALADETPRHRVAVGIDLDGAVVADDAGELAQAPERRPIGERLQPVRLVTLEAGDRRLPGRAVQRTFATSRSHFARCASNTSQLSKACPAIAFLFT